MAESLYVPDPTAQDTLVQPWDEAFRAQRDVGLLVPINFHTVPSVSLRAACFSTNQYEDLSFQKCFSNLLAVGLRRFVIDTYWDALRGEWSLCPAEIPPPSGSGETSSTVPVPTVSLSDSQSSTSAGVVASIFSAGLKRQERSSQSDLGSTTSSSGSSLGSSTVSSSVVTTFTSSSAATFASSTALPTSSSSVAVPTQALGDGILFQLGDYNCTSTMTLNYLTGIFNDFLDATATTTDASFTYLLLNIHAAASWQRPNEPAQQPAASLLPEVAGNLLSDIMKGNLSDALYTHSKLADQRAQLGKSWNDADDSNHPRPGYYSVQEGSDGVRSTDNGWPDEAYIQFHKFYSFIAIFGTIDPQMESYNRSQDASTIFPPDTLNFQRDITFDEDGTLKDGCLFDPSATGITAQTNSSFAVATVPSTVSVSANPDLFDPIDVVSNLTACGISPMLNHTLANVTADVNPLPYAAFTHSYLWSWAPGEPLNATDPDSSDATGNRCAAAFTGGAYPGRWHVVNCSTPLRTACQDFSSPYSWSLSPAPTTYGRADEACASMNLLFSVPHTPLENTHLLSAARTASPLDPSHIDTSSVLINLNSMDIAGCWVTEVNGTCPYRPSSDQNQTRIVVVPTVAAVIIFVCAALTFFVKCAAIGRED